MFVCSSANYDAVRLVAILKTAIQEICYTFFILRRDEKGCNSGEVTKVQGSRFIYFTLFI